MKSLGKSGMRWNCALLGLIIAAALMHSYLTVREQENAARVTERMKTVCIGRFLIDLPADAQVDIQSSFIGGFDIHSTDKETDQEFDAHLSRLESQIAVASDERKRPDIESIKGFSEDDARGKVIVFDRQRVETLEDGRLVDIEDVSVAGVFRMAGVSISASADHRALNAGARLEQFFKRIRRLGPGEIPPEAGFCINRAIVRDPLEHKGNERVTMVASLPGHPDINIVFASMAGADPSPGLLKRHESTVEHPPFFAQLAFTYLSRLPRTINGLDGDELIVKVREPNFTTGYSFQWEMQGQPADVLAPSLMLEFESGNNPVAGGKPVSSSLSEEQMRGLWERMAGSIRLRSTNSNR